MLVPDPLVNLPELAERVGGFDVEQRRAPYQPDWLPQQITRTFRRR